MSPFLQPSPTQATGSAILRRLGRVVAAGGMTALLLVFLAATRWLDSSRMPDREIRELELIEEVALPAPPPPPLIEPVDPPPPPPPPKLPRLEVQLDNVAPPLKATIDRNIDLTMATADFELEVDPPPVPVPAPPKPTPRYTPKPTSSPVKKAAPAPMRTTYSAGELDARPRLVNRPSATYPASQLRKGVRQGKVTLEVSISTSGRCSVRRVISSSHPDFTTMAKSFAARARFTVPKKNGQAVNAIYRWPLILQP